MRGLILSAGLGERLRPATDRKAKPAIEFLNIPMLTFPYHWLNTLGLKVLAFNTHHLAETVRHAAMHVVDPRIALHFVHEEAILGSGGGIWNSRFHLQSDEDFAVANGDGVILCEDDDVLIRMRDFHLDKKALATILVCPLEGVGERIPGVWMDADGEVGNFGKAAKKPSLSCFHYASYMIFSPRLWQHLPQGPSNILYDVLEPLIERGEKVYGYRVDNMRWYETGNPRDYLTASREVLNEMHLDTRLGKCARRILERHGPPMWQSSDLGRLRLQADSAVVAESASLKGLCVLGENCRVDAYAKLENCVVLPDMTIAENQIHRDEIVIVP
jgi:NDP-sugar pyrophosphorylase family protein